MAAKVMKITANDGKQFVLEMYADTKEEMSDPSVEDFAWSKVKAGSTIYTASLDVGVVKADGTISWS